MRILVCLATVAAAWTAAAGSGFSGEVQCRLLPAPQTRPADAPAGGAPATQPDAVRYGTPRHLANLANRSVNESSGLACSRRQPGVFWTHNDSGDKPVLYAFDASGADLGAFAVAGAGASDWEDVCSFTLEGKAYLLIADVGDNGSRRSRVTLYLVPEPRLADLPRGGKLEVERKINVVYEDGPRNCESVAFDPATRTIYLVSKMMALECKVYALALPDKSTTEPIQAKAVATLRIPLTSGMDMSPDGRRCVVLCYQWAFEWTRGPEEKWSDAFGRKPRMLELPRRQQGESICYGPDGRSLYLTSEGSPCPLWELPAEGGSGPATQPAGR